MASLKIRNITIHAIELISVERFESEKVSVDNVFSNVGSAINGFLNATTVTFYEVRPKGEGRNRQDVSFAVEPFRTVQTDVSVGDHPAREVVRLAFQIGGHHYETDVPSPSSKSAVMRKLDNGPLDLTVVYVPSAALLAVFSSAKLNAWMGELDDAWPLSVLSVPGTHNSPTCHKALPSVRCQAVGVPEQLRNGVRFLDVRVSVSPDSSRLGLVHSAFPISLTGTKYFGDMLEDVYAFLDENPSETLLMSIKREGTGKGTDQDLSKYLKDNYVDIKRDRWWTEPAMPALGRARGRIVVVRRFNLHEEMQRECWGGRGWGIDASRWPDNCEDGVVGDGKFLRVQDFYEVTESQNIEKKVRFSEGELERAAEQVFRIVRPSSDAHTDTDTDTDTNKDTNTQSNGTTENLEIPPPFFVNFLSASNFFNATCWPERIAAKVNPAIIEYLCSTHGEEGKGPAKLSVGLAGTGVVVTDWVGANSDWDLIRCIVGMNARLQQVVQSA